MTDDLRTRIAEVLYRDALGLTTPNTVFRQAEGIIAELKLTPQYSFGTTYPNVPVEDRRLVRYVTNWEPAE